METVDTARRAAPRRGAESGSPFAAELIANAAALARGQQRNPARSASLPDELRRGLRGSDSRARRVPPGLGQAAALDFLGEALTAAAVDHCLEPGEARATVVAAAAELGLPADATAFVVFRRALASKECIQLPPPLAAELVLTLLVEFAPAAAASLWALDGGGATRCLLAGGKAARSRGLREAARTALDGVVSTEGHIRAHLVDRWDRPYAALVARAQAGDAGQLAAYLADAATALAPMLESATMVDNTLENERHVIATGERRLVRLGADLHDGPLQEVVVLAEELRLASAQIQSLVAEENRSRVHGRFDDLHARLESLDESLRDIARATRSTTAAAPPVEEALRAELERLERATGIETELSTDGELSDLTDSQNIVLFRVAQEALSNVRKHSCARHVSIALRSTRTLLDLAISDDGRGFDAGKIPHDRLGLAGISERVRLLGGTVEVHSRPGAGVKLHATLPQWRPSTRAGAPLFATGT